MGRADAYPRAEGAAGGTIGGSLANNDPSACYPAAVLGSGVTLVTTNRQIAVDDFFEGMFTTALEDGDVIIEGRVPLVRGRGGAVRGFLAGRDRGAEPFGRGAA